ELSWRAHATAKHDGGVEACQTTTNEPTAVLAPTLTFASASGGLPTSMIPSAVHPQDLSRDLLTERSWGTSREGGITDDIKAETDRLLVARDSTLRHAPGAGVQRAPPSIQAFCARTTSFPQRPLNALARGLPWRRLRSQSR